MLHRVATSLCPWIPLLFAVSSVPPLHRRLTAEAAFVAVAPSLETTFTKKNHPHRRLFLQHNPGAGLPTVPPGNRGLFDPASQGKLSDHPEILQQRLQYGSNYDPATVSSSSTTTSTTALSSEQQGELLLDCQDWLEHYDHTNIPLNMYKPQQPGTAVVLGRTRLIDEDIDGDIEHIVLKMPDDFHYMEGQSLSVIPPGMAKNNNKPHKPRLYSIASTRYGDVLDGNTVSLCVRLNEFTDKDTGEPQYGVCSDFLCHVRPGDSVSIAGPIGKTMLLPAKNNIDIIMVATGTGMAPFRGFLHRLFVEETVAKHMFGGTAWLILGVPTSGGLLYREELESMMQYAPPGQLEMDFAISREQSNALDGGKLYVQHVLQQQSDKLFERMQSGAHIYFCGLKGMMPGILTALEEVCVQRNMNWKETLKEWQANQQWHVEVY